MPDIIALIRAGATNLWLFMPSAVLLGALHGLEPGHSKTMMAAFIVAIRGTVAQAVLLGLSATLSHTAVVWAVALGGLYFCERLNLTASEPVFQLASAGLMLAVSGWMVWRTWRENRISDAHGHMDDHGHDQDHDHGHPRGHDHSHQHNVAHAYGDTAAADRFQDAHARAHAAQIERRFAGGRATTGQIIVFGLTGGLVPCPASITVLLLCLQLKQIAMGAALVLGFSLGLAATMVSVGIVAAIGLRQAERRWAGAFAALARRAPYASGALIAAVSLALAAQALVALNSPAFPRQ